MQKNNTPSKIKKGVIKLLAIAGDATFCGGLPINTAFTEFGEWDYESWKKRQWKKYIGFFKETEGITIEQKESILKKFPSEEIDKVEDFILYLLDAVDGPEKAKLIGKAYKAWIQNVLDTEELFRICDIIYKSYISHISGRHSSASSINKSEVKQSPNSVPEGYFQFFFLSLLIGRLKDDVFLTLFVEITVPKAASSRNT